MLYLNFDIINKLMEPDTYNYKYTYAAINPQTNELIISGLFRNNIYFKSYALNPDQLNKVKIPGTDIYKSYLHIDLNNDTIKSYTIFDASIYNPLYVNLVLYEYNKHLYPSQYAIDHELTKCCI